MKKQSIALATALAFTAGLAFAGHCPKEMKSIDEALAKSPKLTEAQMSDVKAARAKGEELHKAGKHAESLAELAKAQKVLGITPGK